MKQKIFSALIIIVAFFLGINSNATVQGVSGGLIAIKKTVDNTINQSSTLFVNNNRTYMSAIVTVDNSNQYIQLLQIYRDYKIILQFAASSPTSGGSCINVNIPRALLNKKIVFVPEFTTQPKDGGGQEAIINSWSCYTNADEGVELFMGDDTSALVGYLSFISNRYNRINSQYLSSCTYISTTDLESLSLNLLDIPS